MSVDASGNLYVADEFATLLIFSAGSSGNTPPMATLSGSNTGLCYVFDVKVDSNGYVYALNNACPFPSGGQFGSVTVYAPLPNGNISPIRTLTGPYIGYPRGFFVASDGRIFVQGVGGNGKGKPYVANFAAGAEGNVTPVSIISGSKTKLISSADNGLAVDLNAGLMYISDSNHKRVLAFGVTDSGNVPPRAILKGSKTGLNKPVFLSL
jgi:hypothetical protein